MNHIDEQIAIKLFGWHWLAFDGYAVPFDPCRVRSMFPLETNGYWEEYLKRKNAGPANGTEPLSGSPWVPKPPRFHDNETACFRQLIPAMEKRGFDFYCIKKPKELYRVEFVCNLYHLASGVTMAEAICKAALRALEGDNA